MNYSFLIASSAGAASKENIPASAKVGPPFRSAKVTTASH